jgi:cell division protein FtsN
VAPAATQAAGEQAAVARPTLVRRAPEPKAGASRVTVQVISSPDPDEARARLERINTRFHAAMEALSTRVEPATVRGRPVYRGMVAGFASRAEAAAFCETLKSAGQACLLHWPG